MQTPANSNPLIVISAVLLMSALFFVFFYRFIKLVQERNAMRKELSLARSTAKICDALTGSLFSKREKIKQVGRVLADEGGKYGWRCRIVTHDDAAFLPPSGGNLGFHMPMAVGDMTLGTLIITGNAEKLDEHDRAFYESLVRTLAHFLYKEKLWDDFHLDLERMQASLLLQVETAPQNADSSNLPQPQTVEHMLGMLGMAQGRPEVPKPRY